MGVTQAGFRRVVGRAGGSILHVTSGRRWVNCRYGMSYCLLGRLGKSVIYAMGYFGRGRYCEEPALGGKGKEVVVANTSQGGSWHGVVEE